MEKKLEIVKEAYKSRGENLDQDDEVIYSDEEQWKKD